jgi:hypothetical protein
MGDQARRVFRAIVLDIERRAVFGDGLFAAMQHVKFHAFEIDLDQMALFERD